MMEGVDSGIAKSNLMGCWFLSKDRNREELCDNIVIITLVINSIKFMIECSRISCRKRCTFKSAFDMNYVCKSYVNSHAK